MLNTSSNLPYVVDRTWRKTATRWGQPPVPSSTFAKARPLHSGFAATSDTWMVETPRRSCSIQTCAVVLLFRLVDDNNNNNNDVLYVVPISAQTCSVVRASFDSNPPYKQLGMCALLEVVSPRQDTHLPRM